MAEHNWDQFVFARLEVTCKRCISDSVGSDAEDVLKHEIASIFTISLFSRVSCTNEYLTKVLTGITFHVHFELALWVVFVIDWIPNTDRVAVFFGKDLFMTDSEVSKCLNSVEVSKSELGNQVPGPKIEQSVDNKASNHLPFFP